MGGDKAPVPEVEGAIHAAREYGHRVLLVGDGPVVETRALSLMLQRGDLPIEVVHAPERITMDDHAAKAARAKKESSMHVCARLVAAGKADGFISAGNTGACMAIAKMVLGKVPGVDRPALSGVFPTHKGTPVVVVDVGANVDCEPQMLQQFGLMGEVYSRLRAEGQAAARGLAFDRRGRTQGQRAHPGYDAAAEIARHQFHRQRGRPRHFFRARGCDRLRRIRGQCRAQGERRLVGDDSQHAARIAGGDGFAQNRLCAFAIRLQGFQEASRLFRVRRRAAAGRQGRLHHLPRPVGLQRDQECDPRGGGVCIQQHEPAHRRRVARISRRRVSPHAAIFTALLLVVVGHSRKSRYRARARNSIMSSGS